MAKIKYPENDKEKARLYLHAMLEIKERIYAANAALSSNMISLFKHEICQLHVRHICELISIACLAAQGDYETQRAFTEEHSPPKIFNSLRKLYPHFFPQSCTVTSTPLQDGRNAHRLHANHDPSIFTEREITKAWSRSGSYLHRTSVKKYLSTGIDKASPPLEPVIETLQGLLNLLASHVVAVSVHGPEKVLLQIILNDEQGRVQAFFLRVNTDNGAMNVDEFYGEVLR